jgi:hypothetical protein
MKIITDKFDIFDFKDAMLCKAQQKPFEPAGPPSPAGFD